MMDDENRALRAINLGFRAVEVIPSNTSSSYNASMAPWTRSEESMRSIHEFILIKADTEQLMGGFPCPRIVSSCVA
jgi:hypothetical protein